VAGPVGAGAAAGSAMGAAAPAGWVFLFASWYPVLI